MHPLSTVHSLGLSPACGVLRARCLRGPYNMGACAWHYYSYTVPRRSTWGGGGMVRRSTGYSIGY